MLQKHDFDPVQVRLSQTKVDPDTHDPGNVTEKVSEVPADTFVRSAGQIIPDTIVAGSTPRTSLAGIRVSFRRASNTPTRVFWSYNKMTGIGPNGSDPGVTSYADLAFHEDLGFVFIANASVEDNPRYGKAVMSIWQAWRPLGP